MKRIRQISLMLLLVIVIASMAADILAPGGYSTQYREVPNAAPGRHHLLGTDALGRDRMAPLFERLQGIENEKALDWLNV